MKKWATGIVVLSSIVTLTACGSGSTAKKEDKGEATASNSKTAVTVESGMYIVPDGETVKEGSGYLALNVKLENKGKDTLDVYGNEITLYDEDDNKISGKDVYDSTDKFKTMQSGNISGGKSTSGYLVFEVEKDKKYELHYAPTEFSDKKSKEIEIKVDPKKYKDTTGDVKDLTEQYINTVFLNKTDDKAAKTNDSKDDKKADSKDTATLSNNLTEEHDAFNKEFATALGDQFNNYQASEAELMKPIEAFEAANAKKAKITYTIKQYLPEAATIYVKPETIKFDDLDTDSIVNDFVNKNEAKYTDYDKAQRDAEKYLLEQLPTKFDSATVSASDSSNGEGYEVNLKKEDGKWTVDSSDNSDNYDFDSLKQDFRGELYN